MENPKTKHTYVDHEIARLVLALQEQEPGTDEYETLLDRLGKLQKIRQEEKPSQVSSDAILMAATNILGIVLILRHENLNVITSQAMSLLRRTK